MSNKKDLEKVDELLAFTQQAKYFFEKIANIIQGQQEQQNNEPYGVPGSSRAVSSRAVSSRGSSQAGSQQEPILRSDTAVTSGISEKGEESAVISATNEKEDESAGAVTSATNEKEDVSAVTSATNEKYRGNKKAVKKKILTMVTKIPEKPSAIKQREKPQSNQVQTIQVIRTAPIAQIVQILPSI
ncbi:hypothetical protein GLOIN_2v1845756 [Rhizophagus irregularis DAOM 181602=DAOM 197198]|nr:hypothetical protein GLOIN_2v1845756 [Rhizophagus irregularis DAOM 181602=DAOM 197198]